MDSVVLRAGRLAAVLLPDIGGCVASFRINIASDWHALMREMPPGSPRVLDAASFPIVPFANRIRGGRFSFRGRNVALPPNMQGESLPLHGQGWCARWTVVSREPSKAELVYEHTPDSWPWRYRARQTFALTKEVFTIELSCRNLSDSPMPCGLGHHPYFPCTNDTVLDAQVEGVTTVDDDVLPVSRVPARDRYDLHTRLICGAFLDNGYDGWNGRADIAWPGRGLKLRLEAETTRIQIYAPKAGGFFVAEPVTNANAALNAPEDLWPALGLAVLDPAQELSLAMRLSPF